MGLAECPIDRHSSSAMVGQVDQLNRRPSRTGVGTAAKWSDVCIADMMLRTDWSLKRRAWSRRLVVATPRSPHQQPVPSRRRASSSNSRPTFQKDSMTFWRASRSPCWETVQAISTASSPTTSTRYDDLTASCSTASSSATKNALCTKQKRI